mgnify:CR=1 FL=1
MNITVIGSGYVGLVSGTCFAEMGNSVTCVDIDPIKIEKLNQGIIPIFEPGLETMVLKNVKNENLFFTTALHEALQNSEIAFIAVGTPMGDDGSADLQYVLAVAKSIGQSMQKRLIVVDKSTVPIGTADKVKATIQKELDIRNSDLQFDVVSNPEFLKEGAAIADFMKPDRVVIGADSDYAAEKMKQLYHPFCMSRDRFISMDIRSAEMTKYAANSMLATKISFMNDIANLCEVMGADVNLVRKGIGSDTRIGNKFIYPGIGYGGSCFPKDVQALIRTADQNGYEMQILKAVEAVNYAQKEVLFNKILKHYNGDISGKHFAMWGLSFKPNTDDMREAPSVVLTEKILAAGGTVSAYDPVAAEEAKHQLGDRITYCADEMEAVRGADALALITEWAEFRVPDWSAVANEMNGKVLFDGRNLYRREIVGEVGFDYFGIGQGEQPA